VQELLTLTVSGAITGAIFSLFACGLTLSYTATGIFNFSYGAIAYCSALLYYELHVGLDWPIVPAAVMCLVVLPVVLGVVLNLAVFRPLARATPEAKIMATIGLLLALPSLARWIVDQLRNTFDFDIPDYRQVFQPVGIGPVPKKRWNLPGDIAFESDQLIVLIASVVVAIALWYLMRRTTLGLQMRAVVDRAPLAEMRGVDEGRTSYTAWIVGMFLACLAGVIGAPLLPQLDANIFTLFIFIAAAATVLGGLRSIPLAFLGGIVLGILRSLVAGSVWGVFDFADNIQGFENAIPFVVLLLGMVVIGRDRSRRGGTAAEAVPPASFTDDLTPARRWAPWVVWSAFLVVYIVFLADDTYLGTMVNGLALAMVFLSFTVVTGMGGMVSLAQTAFVTASGLTVGVLAVRYDWPLFFAVLGGIAVAVVLGVVVAIPALRLGGLPLALATLALAFAGDQVLFQWNWFRNSQSGWRLPRPDIGPLDLNNDQTLALVLLVQVAAIVLMINLLQRSLSGRQIVAVRTSEPASATSGISVVNSKVQLFALSAAIAALGGFWLATYNKSATNAAFTTPRGLFWLASVVLFGIRRPGGAVIAGIVSALTVKIVASGIHVDWFGFLEWIDWDGFASPDIPNILFGIGAIQLARQPDGILAITTAQNQRARQRRAAKRAARVGAGVVVPEVSHLDRVISAEEAADAAAVERRSDDLVRAGVVAAPPVDVASAAGVDDPEAVLVLRDVSSGYGPVKVLYNINLALRRGTITAVVGANGAGKTTLCLTCAGLVPVTAGTMTLHGGDITTTRGFRRARQGLVLAPEQRGIFPGLSVQENLQLWVPDPGARAEAYDRFPQLRERRALPAGSLSGGEQQMLTLAPLLVKPPEVLIVDEPSLGLGPLIVERILGVFGELRDRGVALLLVEEKARDVLQVADEVAFLELGRIGWIGARADVDEERLAAAYLGAHT
jgi:branched-subunit amino acid ABC-type transport system permease component/ABC-type branched-subunit amino acid transport system ATPase component